nr:aspartate/glutamate racemase family protein [Rickettsia endosymbiont of Ceutorhynchus assimilis]
MLNFSLEDGFFAKTLEQKGIHVIIPNQEERDEMQRIQSELMQNIITTEARDYFGNLITAYKDVNAVVLGCTEYPLVVDQNNSILPIIDPVYLQATYAIDYALSDYSM